MKAVLDILELQGELEWARCVGGVKPLRPPFVAWRYKISDDNIELEIANAIASYTGSVKWIIRKGKRNWVIEPAAFQTYAMNFRVDVEALQRYGEEFPSETNAALDDAPRLAEHMQRILRARDNEE